LAVSNFARKSKNFKENETFLQNDQNLVILGKKNFENFEFQGSLDFYFENFEIFRFSCKKLKQPIRRPNFCNFFLIGWILKNQ
jgi:hypothetical protein